MPSRSAGTFLVHHVDTIHGVHAGHDRSGCMALFHTVGRPWGKCHEGDALFDEVAVLLRSQQHPYLPSRVVAAVRGVIHDNQLVEGGIDGCWVAQRPRMGLEPSDDTKVKE